MTRTHTYAALQGKLLPPGEEREAVNRKIKPDQADLVMCENTTVTSAAPSAQGRAWATARPYALSLIVLTTFRWILAKLNGPGSTFDHVNVCFSFLYPHSYHVGLRSTGKKGILTNLGSRKSFPRFCCVHFFSHLTLIEINIKPWHVQYNMSLTYRIFISR